MSAWPASVAVMPLNLPLHTATFLSLQSLHSQHPSGDGDEGDPWGKLQTGGRIVTNLRRYRVSRKYSLLINVDKTKVMASDDIACHILIQNEQLEQVDTFPYLGSLTTEDGECTTEFHNRLNRDRRSGHHYRKLIKVLVWPVATYDCERMKKHVLTPLRWKGWDRFCACGFRGQQRKQMSGFLTKLE